MSSRYTPEQHADAASRIFYEATMLVSSFQLHKRAMAERAKAVGKANLDFWWATQTCALEAFLVHYRNLKQFLNNQKVPDDAKAIDYAHSWSGDNNVNASYPDEDDRINKLLQHISYKRLDLQPGD